MPDNTVFLMAGRSVTNYLLHGKTVPRDFFVVPCTRCDTKVALSPEGHHRLMVARRTRGILVAGVLCSPCSISISAPGAEFAFTENIKRQMAEKPQVKADIDELMRKNR
jgi:hypothetical protein